MDKEKGDEGIEEKLKGGKLKLKLKLKLNFGGVDQVPLFFLFGFSTLAFQDDIVY